MIDDHDNLSQLSDDALLELIVEARSLLADRRHRANLRATMHITAEYEVDPVHYPDADSAEQLADYVIEADGENLHEALATLNAWAANDLREPITYRMVVHHAGEEIASTNDSA